MKFLYVFILAVSAFGGQSIEFGPHFIYSSTPVPNSPVNRTEFYIHDWSPSGITHLVSSGATGWLGYTEAVSATNVTLLIYNTWESGGQLAGIQIGMLAQHAVYVRCQHDPVNKVDLIEAWDIDGNRIFSNSLSYASETDAGTDFQLGYGGEPTVSLAFMRVHSTLVPLNSRPPVTSDNADRVLEWKFDGDLSDASGSGHAAIFYNGTPVYVATPYQNTVAEIKTSDANSWASVLTQRAGYPAPLDGTSSYSQADSSAAVTCFWQQLSGPSQAQFTSRTGCNPVLTGLVFGDYLLQLTVTDANGNPVVATTDMGVVATDSKGVVVNADPNVDALFGMSESAAPVNVFFGPYH